MIEKNLKDLIQYVILVAGESDWNSRELGPIHILKYVYLADMYYAARNNGETYTKIPWRFYHFGPWEPTVYRAIDGAAIDINANIRNIPSAFSDDDYKRYSLTNTKLLDDYERTLPLPIIGRLKKDIKKYGSATSDLLDKVYKTKPMLNAAPGEYLDFSTVISPPIQIAPCVSKAEDGGLSKSAIKKKKTEQEARRAKLQARLKNDIEKRAAHKENSDLHVPKYDKKYLEIMEALDSIDECDELVTEGVILFGDDVWRSSLRRDLDEC